MRIRVKSIKGEMIDKMHKKLLRRRKSCGQVSEKSAKRIYRKNPRDSINLQLVVRFRTVRYFSRAIM